MRQRNQKLILYYCSIFVMLIGLIQLMPLLVLPFYPEEVNLAYCFIIPGIISILAGGYVKYRMRNIELSNLDKHYDAVLIVLVWILAIVISTAPWLLSGHYNFSQAMFEMTSGFSTTGLSVVDVDVCPKIFLVFRSITLFVGGIGLVLILTCTISDSFGLNLYNAEGHNDRLMPNLKKSARFILSIYSVYIIAGIVAYHLAGMTWFDAFNTSIAALSTGGFSTSNESIYHYHSLPIEIITIVLMLLGQTNFMIHLSILRGKFKNVIYNVETKFFIVVAVISFVLMNYSLISSKLVTDFGEATRITVFQLVSGITTTGFISVSDLRILPSGFVSMMILLMLIGGNMESTAGGIKQYRVILALKGIWNSIKNTVSDKRIIKVNYTWRAGNKVNLSEDQINSTTTYVLFYVILFLIGSAIFSLEGYNLQDAMFEFSSALSTVGLSVGITGYHASNLILWTGIIGMFFGRLEIMIIFEAVAIMLKRSKRAKY